MTYLWGFGVKSVIYIRLRGDLFLTKVLENFIGIFERGDLGKVGWGEMIMEKEIWVRGEVVEW